MTAPRLEIDLGKINHNARTLVRRLALRGIEVMGVTKASLGSPAVANEMVLAGVDQLGDSRLENIETMRRAGIVAPMALIRSPMLSQVERVAEHVDLSFHTELEVLGELSRAAQKLGKIHGIVLMVELGDLREGLFPCDVEKTVSRVLNLPNLVLKGIGTNLACLNGVVPDLEKMSELSELADSIEATFGLTLEMISGGNSANLSWALGEADTGRVNHLRLGESILLGRETLHRRPIEGLFTDAFTLTAEVIESKLKPSVPWGQIAQTAFGDKSVVQEQGRHLRAILALGRQDADPQGLSLPTGFAILGASSDHLIVDCGPHEIGIGSEMAFQLNYGALVRSMTSPFVVKVMSNQSR
ncbi:MAG: alanine/ornithine racemase family PLP-dependent enzyme [Planctomycetota bacterium]|jgi:predicted amino acid racemase